LVRNPNRIELSDTIDRAARLGADIRLRCSSKPLTDVCGHIKVMTAVELAALCTERGWSRELFDIGAKLACSKCGSHWPHIEVVGQKPAGLDRD